MIDRVLSASMIRIFFFRRLVARVAIHAFLFYFVMRVYDRLYLPRIGVEITALNNLRYMFMVISNNL